jgi:hypothetical protein
LAKPREIGDDIRDGRIDTVSPREVNPGSGGWYNFDFPIE